jgi:hypothetical protein
MAQRTWRGQPGKVGHQPVPQCCAWKVHRPVHSHAPLRAVKVSGELPLLLTADVPAAFQMNQ